MRYLSLFSGMEAAYLAWHPLGWECAGVAEVDPRACEVLAHRLNASAPKYLPDDFDPKRYAHLPPFGSPGTLPNFGDVSQVTDDDVAALGHVDVLIGGSPCQDLSVAGKRAGLAGARSGLFHEQLRIFHATRHFCGARWLVWENVPGAFSSNAGGDFAVVVGAMAGLELAVPEDGWGSEGLALGPAGLVEWSVLDAQWFGVAQRRRRVFAVLDTGDWSGRGPVLLEPESLRGDSAPRREAREGTPERAKDGPGDGRWPALVAPTLNCAFGNKQGLEDQHALSGAGLFVPDYVNAITAHNGSRNEVSDMLNGCIVEVDPERVRVRRVTPRECERLQGAVDDWTLVPSGPKGRPMADGPRYKILGNSFAVPVIRWLGIQIQRAHQEVA